jgi:hypothetical protein
MKVTRGVGTRRGEKFLELNRTHGLDGLKERAVRAETHMDIEYCMEVLKLTGGYVAVEKRGTLKKPKGYQKIETLEQASQYVIDSIKKDNVVQSAIDFEKKYGAKNKCIEEINYENHFVKLERELRAIQSVIDWLPSTRENNKWKDYATHPRLLKYARPSVSRGLKRGRRKSNSNTRL